MKRFLLSLAAAATLVVAVPVTASAAPWQSVNQRQDNIERRIDQGVRKGDLTRAEAQRLRGQFRELAQLERQYRRSGGGLSVREREELDRRFDRLSQHVYAQRHDHQERRY
ncbi:hypothetical protein [Phenylobacterium sp.]|jgi:Spy/CpxP family protein refolding chaperone|uniref:hypothetical protein n=1 Tax=Phenylobacterium sp. TaxID=1871053 RepID=UPI002E362165|nr:hypothetical protein [Phenylobacterium sp.]HEX2562078.1 hypothetical protein [Phenylobacterium sp.]